MKQDIIEQLILFVADALEKGTSFDDVVHVMATQPSLPPKDLSLIVIAGKILYQARVDAPPKKTLIKRVT